MIPYGVKQVITFSQNGNCTQNTDKIEKPTAGVFADNYIAAHQGKQSSTNDSEETSSDNDTDEMSEID